MKITPESERTWLRNGRPVVDPSEAEIAEEARKIREENLARSRRESEAEKTEPQFEDDDDEQDRD